ncbi:MAG: bifunctional glycosyltransferase family 2/GtrA family protein [Eubacteriales bacterium]|nr:bifunctional glycosyltransferase family 2/GtrA family protein [Eubacteriales bacterium]
MSQAVILIPSLHPDDKLGNYVSALVKSGFEHIVVVDDGSGPAYAHCFEALKAHPQCDVLGYETNRGKGYALKHGMDYISAAYPDAPGVITADSDGQHTVDDCLKVGAAMLHTPDQLVLGTRDFSQSDVPSKSRMGNRLTTFFFALLYGRWLPDTQTGLRGISRELMPRITKVPGDRFEYEMNMLVYCAGWHIGFNKVAISTIYLEENKSSHFRPFQDSARIYAQLFRNFFKFASNSLLSTLLDLGLFMLLDKWLLRALFPALMGGRSYYQVLAATALARACSAMFNYKVNKQFVFRVKESRGSLWRYAVLVAAVMITSATLVNALNLWLGMGRTLAKIIVDTTLFFVNYRVQKSWVFKRPVERNH